MKQPCEIIRDLLPLYHDGVCSEQSAQAVEEHLPECPPCTDALEAIRAEVRAPPLDTAEAISTGEAMRALARRWRRSKILMGVTWAAVTAAVLVSGFIMHDVLFVQARISIPASQVEVAYLYRDRDDGYLHFRLRIKDGRGENSSFWGGMGGNANENGDYTPQYITAYRPLIVLNPKPGALTCSAGWGVRDFDAQRIYYGTPEDHILLWEPGMEVPKLTLREAKELYGDLIMWEWIDIEEFEEFMRTEAPDE